MDDLLGRFRQAASRRGSRHGNYAPEVRALAVSFARSRVREGRSAYAASRELGLPSQTLRKWLGSRERVRAAGAPRGFRSVRLMGSAPLAQCGGALVVTTASGHRVQGLGVDEALRLLRGLEARA